MRSLLTLNRLSFLESTGSCLFSLDSRCSYYCSPNLAYGAISNMVTLVDEAFIENLEYDRLYASNLSLIVQVSFIDFFLYFPRILT